LTTDDVAGSRADHACAGYNVIGQSFVQHHGSDRAVRRERSGVPHALPEQLLLKRYGFQAAVCFR
jgi:hypothetical protein